MLRRLVSGGVLLVVLQSTEGYDEEAAEMLALSVLEECEDGMDGVRRCLVGFVRSDRLRPMLGRAVGKAVEWRDELEKWVDAPDIVYMNPVPRRYGGFDYEECRCRDVPSLPALNGYCKRAYDSCISGFREALSGLCGRVESEDFFPDLGDSEEKMAGRLTDLGSLKSSIAWREGEIAELYGRYDDGASKVWAQAREIREVPEWKSLVAQKERLIGSRDRLSGELFIELISKSRREINAFVLNHVGEDGKWKELVKSVGRILECGALANGGDGDYFDGFDDLVVYFMSYGHGRESQWSCETLFEKDLEFSRGLAKRMKLMLLENGLNRVG